MKYFKSNINLSSNDLHRITTNCLKLSEHSQKKKRFFRDNSKYLKILQLRNYHNLENDSARKKSSKSFFSNRLKLLSNKYEQSFKVIDNFLISNVGNSYRKR